VNRSLREERTYLVAIKGFESDDYDSRSIGIGSEGSGYHSGDGEAENAENAEVAEDAEDAEDEEDQIIQVWRLDEPNHIHSSANVRDLQKRHNRQFDAVTTICMSRKGEYIAFGTSGGMVWIAHVSGLNKRWTIIDWDGSDPIWQVCLLTCGTTVSKDDLSRAPTTRSYRTQ
jgi:hypothetical protein